MDNVRDIFAKRLKELRYKNDISMRELALSLGVSHVIISFYESAKREPTIGACKAIAEYFGVSMDYLVGLTDDPKPKK